MNPSSRCSKMPAELSASTQQRLNMYALAASAAGVGVLALLQPAEAKIVYTPTHQVTNRRTPLYIDLNHDGINDFAISTYYAGGSGFTYGIRAYQVPKYTGTNRVMGKGNYAYALRAGVEIGPKKQFNPGDVRMASWIENDFSTKRYFRGLWANHGKGVKNRYLGFRFVVNGKIHFGWARVTITFGNNKRSNLYGTLTGYAYETIPGKAIIAGATKGPDDAEPTTVLSSHTPEPVTLGALAMGAPGLSIWRREERAESTQ